MIILIICATLAHYCTTVSSLADNTSAMEKDPCLPFVPQKINFESQGRKINKVKCYEYLLDFKNREQELNQKQECELKRQNPLEGTEYVIGEYPHMAAIGWKVIADQNMTEDEWRFLCGGSLISSRFVLTAAHCTRRTGGGADLSYENIFPDIVRLGVKDLSKKKRVRRVIAKYPGPVDVKILRSILYPDYSPPKRYFDIALLELAHDVKFTMLIQPACLWNSEDVSSIQTKTLVTGWGVTDLASHYKPAELQVTSIDLVDSAVCDELLKDHHNRRWQGLQNQICAGGKIGIDTCQGDSGGPLQTRMDVPLKRSAMYYIVGVTSFGYSCGLPNRPSIYTRVSSFINWIEDIVWPAKTQTTF